MANENLTDLPGVGQKTAENLRRAGFDSYEKISKATPRQLSRRVSGIGMKGAGKIVDAAGGDVITISKRSKEDRLQDRYGNTFQRIDETPAQEIEDEILESETTDFTTGVTSTPDDTVFVPTQQETAESPFRVSTEGPRKRSLGKIHNERTERAQEVDENQNAPLTTDEEKWLQNKNRYDYPGVDTIPRDRLAARAGTAAKVAQDIGSVDRVEQKGNAKTLGGKFSPPGATTYGEGEAVARVQESAKNPGFTLAHEVGHAFDYGVGDDPNKPGLQDKLFEGVDRRPVVGREFDEDTNQVQKEAMQLSERSREGGGHSYRLERTELTADVISQAILNPRATKRDAPELFGRLTDIAEDEGFAEAIPNPLNDNSERQGYLK